MPPTPGSQDAEAWLRTLSPGDLAALLACQDDVLALLAQHAPLTALLECICSGLEDLMPASRCSILVTDHDGALRHGAAPSLPADYQAAVDGLRPGPEAGSCGTAAFYGRPVVVEDISVDPRWAQYVPLAAAAGLAACWSTPVLDAERRVIGTFAVYHDHPHRPTQREQDLVERVSSLAAVAIGHAVTLTALEAVEERSRRVFADSALAMALADTSGTVLQVNDSMQRLTGVPGSGIVGRPLADLFADCQRQRIELALGEVASGASGSVALETLVRQQTGDTGRTAATASSGAADAHEHVVPVAVTVSPVRSTDGAVGRLSICAQDLSDAAALRSAQQASQAKSEFLSAISHEIRPPLRAITDAAERLDVLALDDPRRGDAVGQITHGANELVELMDDTLDLARVEAGMLPLQLEQVAVGGLLVEVVDYLGVVAAAYDVHLELRPATVPASADRRRLRRVLVHLVTDAIRAGRGGSTVSVGACLDDDGWSRIEVAYARSNRADDTDPGLRLVLARGLTELMGGTLVRLSTDTATTVSVLLPTTRG